MTKKIDKKNRPGRVHRVSTWEAKERYNENLEEILKVLGMKRRDLYPEERED
jgi:hypothetical protein